MDEAVDLEMRRCMWERGDACMVCIQMKRRVWKQGGESGNEAVDVAEVVHLEMRECIYGNDALHVKGICACV